MDWPCVTAIVNTHKRPALLTRALASVMRQTFKDFELIIIHDGPADDETVSVAKACVDILEQAGIDARFAALEEESGYQCAPKNAATWCARGDYIAYLDDDNEWTDDHLEVLVEAIEDGQDWPDFTYGRREYIDERKVKEPKLVVGPSPFVPFSDDAVKSMSTSPSYNFIDTSDVLFTRGAFWRLYLATERMWNEDYRRFADWELLVRGIFYSGWKGKGVDKIVQRYYWHGGNIQLTRSAKETPKQIPLASVQ